MSRKILHSYLLHPRTGLALEAVGTIRGLPVWPMVGGDGTEDDANDKGDDKGDKGYTPPATQAELDRIVGARLARERERFADYDEMKAKAAEHDKALEAARTDQEKAVEAAKSEGRTEALTAANSRLISAEARALAAEAKFRNPALAVKAIDTSGIKVADDGTVDADAIKAALKTLADAEPYLIDDGKKPTPKPDRSQGGGNGDEAKPSVARGEALWAARHKRPTSA